MRNRQIDVEIASKLKIIEKLSTVKTPDWLSKESLEIYELYDSLREDIIKNQTVWNYFELCHRLSLHYYNIAIIYYKYFVQHKADVNIIKISLDKCLSKLSGIRATEREINRTRSLFEKAAKMKEIIDKIYINLENKLNNTDNKLEKAKYLINLGQVDYENFNFLTEDLASYHSYVLGIYLINLISDVEEILTVYSDKDHYDKANLCESGARAYELCGQQQIHDKYIKRTTQQIRLALGDLGLEDQTSTKFEQIENIIKTQVKDYNNNLVQVYEAIHTEYSQELNHLDCAYIEQEYIKYCSDGLIESISQTLDKIAKTNNKTVFMLLISNMEKVKTLTDLQDYFTANAYYKLLIEHKNLLRIDQEKQIIRQYKVDLWDKISPLISEAQTELDVLKQIILFLRSGLDDYRSIINQLEIPQFCTRKISVEKFVNNILALQLNNNEALLNLKNSTEQIKDKNELFFMDKFIEILKSYSFPPTPRIEGDVLIVEARLIILSEVIQDILKNKSDLIKELRIIGADIFIIDDSLKNENWTSMNVLVISKTINVKGKHVWDVSGLNAEQHDQARAANGKVPGQDGKNGKNGLCGHSGGNVYISCFNMINSENITIKSNGGNGGNGQSGGNGNTGIDGYGIPSSEFENLINPYKPCTTFQIYHQIKTFDIAWSKKLVRLNTEPDHLYLAGKTANGSYIHYSYYPGITIWNDEALILYIGTHAEMGGSGGKAGLAGPGGFSGDITIKCTHAIEMGVECQVGNSGQGGVNGNNGPPGTNGWDMGFVFNNGWFSSTKKIIGKNQNFKIEIQYRNARVDDDYVYIPYRNDVQNRYDYYGGLKMTGKDTQIINRNTHQNQEEEEKSEATRIKAISRSAISECEENMKTDVLDELANLSLQMQNLKEQAQEEMVQKDEEMESEMTQFEIQRQAIFDDSSLEKENKILRKRQRDKKIEVRDVAVEKLLINPKSLELWGSIKPVVINLEDLQQLFSLLYKNKIYVQNKYSEIYNILLVKYKIRMCQEIDKKCKLPEIEVKFTPNPIEKYLVLDETTKEFFHEKLGNLLEYFQPKHQDLLKKLQNFLQNVDIGLIIYPLKFFILEKSYNDTNFQEKSKTVLEKLNNFENKLEMLTKCYWIAYNEDEDTSMLNEIEKYKNKLIDEFKLEKQDEFILKNFSEHIVNIGMSSSAVRELLAVGFRTNIKIFAINQNNEFILCHDHNPISKQPFYLFLVNSQFVQFHMDDNYLNMITERKKLSKNYSDLLAFVNEFVCKKDFDEFYQNFSLFNGYDLRDNMYLEYRKVSKDNLMKQICNYFPPSDYAEIYNIISKLQSGYIENENILKAVLQRFNCEGRHVTLDEMMFLVDIILKSFLDKTVDLELFEWIISIKPQSTWVNELFYLELETYFKITLKKTDVYKYLENIEQKNILLLMHIKLKDTIDRIDLEYITKCLKTLSEIEVDEETIRTLPLSKWRYTLREQLLENHLYCLTKWNSVDELQRALYYINCLESNVGADLINKFIENLNKKKDEITSDICLEIFSLLHTQEWSLNEELLSKISENGINSIKTELQNAQSKINETRSLETVMKLILENSNTSPVIKTTLSKLSTHPILSLKINEPHSEETIKKWAIQFKLKIRKFTSNDKKNFITESTVEILTMIMHAIKLKKGFELRTVQRLSILLMLCHNENTLAQIGTGEGKSIIVVTVSIFKALCGEKVDIITSSSVLAMRDATVNKDIFEIFNIKVNHNCSEKLDDRRDAYSECPVIFGDLSNYQRDYLLDRFYGKNILGDRNFDTILVDEVDSMLLDKGNNTLYLSHDIPGLEKLESVYQFLWRKICMSAGQNIDNFDDYLKKDVLFDLYGTLSIDDLVSSLNITIPVATNIYNYFKEKKVINQKSSVLKTLSTDDISNLPADLKPLGHKLNYILNQILKREIEIKIPKSLYQFVEHHIDTWIKNGLLAIAMEEGIDYVVDVDRTNTKADVTPNITIIDKGTGTDQSNSQWEEALHQFLQLKHGCKISAQSLKAVFISNVSYFKKYKTLFGLTGTLGSEVERDLLKELYDVQFVNIPTAKPKKFIEHEPLLCCTEIDWQYRIVNRTQELTKADRSVLIICETIKEVNNLAKAFQQSDISDRIIYKREYEQCALAQGKEKLGCGKVIIATNLAGRGTDIKITDALNEYGGLHVLVTYLPNSARIEEQAFGRAARAGNNGSGQLVIIGYGSFMDKREVRETRERQRIADIKIYFDTRIKGEETYFNKFNEVYKQCNNSWLEIFTDQKVKEIASERLLDRWAFWLDKYGTNLTDKPAEMNKNFEEFNNDLKKNFSVWSTWTDDPTHLVKIGINYIKKEKLMDSIDVFDIVIKQEPIFSEAAHYYKALALGQLLNFENRPFSQAAENTYQTFLSELQKAKNLFEAQKDICMASSAYVQNLKQNMKNSFMTIDAYKNQQETMMAIYDLFIKSIEDILGHSVTKTSFISQEIMQENSEEIFEAFLNKSVLKYSRVVKPKTTDIEEISTSFGIPFHILSSFVSSYENKDIREQDFLDDLKHNIRMPSLQECWDMFINLNILGNEKKLAIIEKSKLTTEQENMLKKIPQANVNLKTCEGKYVLMKQYVENKDVFIFEESILKKEIDFFESLKKEKTLVCNRIAELSKDKIKNTPIELYNSLTIENFTTNGIEESEATEILDILCKKPFLKKDNNCYKLVGEYDESNIPEIPAYEQTVLQILRLNFAYRIALGNLQKDIENSEEQAYLKIISEPHISLMWELIGRKIIEPVYVKNHTSSDISQILANYGKSDQKESIDKYVKSVLKNLAGSLKSLDTPSFKLAPITDSLEEIHVSRLQELNTFLLNSLEYIIKSEEKKYTLKMILGALFVTILGILEIVAGLCIQLFSAGALSHLGNYLISEGLSDLQYAVSCWWSGYFNWSDYGQHKLKSMLESLIFAAAGALFSRVAKLSKFGEKIAMSGIKNEFGKEISKLTGKELIKEVGGKTIAKEFSKKVIRKVGEGVFQGIVNEGLTHIVDSYLQNMCNQLSNCLIQDIGTAVDKHDVGVTLIEFCKLFGPKEGKEKIVSYTEKCLSETTIATAMVDSARNFVSKISGICGEAAKLSIEIPYVKYISYLGKVLEYTQYLTYITDIVTSVKRVLDRVDVEMKADIKAARAKGVEDKNIDDKDIKKFKNDVIVEWRNSIQKKSNEVFSDKIAKPILHKCTSIIVNESKQNIKKLHNFGQNTYHRHIFNKMKEKKNSKLENLSVSEETKTEIIKSYNKTLQKLQRNIRDPKLYADIVMEKGYMDAICIKAGSAVIGSLRNDKRPVSLKINTDSGNNVEFNTPGIGETRTINIELKNNHFQYEQGENEEELQDYECLYKAIAQKFPELNTITAEEFRKRISYEIQTDKEIKTIIQSGKHEFTIRRNIYGGVSEESIATDDLRRGLLDGRYAMSQSSILEYTSTKVHLFELAASIKNNFDEHGRVNVVVSESGQYIFLDNRRVIAAATINNPDVKILVRIFQFDEEFTKDLKGRYYGEEIAWPAAAKRVNASRSFDQDENNVVPFHPSEIRIRRKNPRQLTTEQKSIEYQKQIKIFNKLLRDMQFIIYSRPEPEDESHRRKRKHDIAEE